MKGSKFILPVLFLLLITSCIRKKIVSDTDNEMTQLGHYLFFDTKLSHNSTKSCSSCHNPEFAFTDGYRTSITASGEHLLRNAPSLINGASYKYYNWCDIFATSYKKQHVRPLFGQVPIELGLDKDSSNIFKTLASSLPYKNILEELNLTVINEALILEAISTYVTKLSSYNSPFDKYRLGDKLALNSEQKKGMNLFFSTRLNCVSCHPPPEFTLNNIHNKDSEIFRRVSIAGMDKGLFLTTHTLSDTFKFRIPGLRNVEFTAPYWHDGSIPNLKSLIKVHKNLSINGSKNPLDNALKTFSLNEHEENQLIKFLHCLSDSTIFANPLFKNPYNE